MKKLNDLTKMKMSPYVKFKLMDSLELWEHEWTPRKYQQDQEIGTIDQVWTIIIIK